MKNGFTAANTNGLYNDAELDAMNSVLRELYPAVDSDDADETLVQHYRKYILERKVWKFRFRISDY